MARKTLTDSCESIEYGSSSNVDLIQKSCRASPRRKGGGASQQWEVKDPNGKIFKWDLRTLKLQPCRVLL